MSPRRPLRAGGWLALAWLAAAPALALAQAEDPRPLTPNGSLPGEGPSASFGEEGGPFRKVPAGPDGRPLEYTPPAPVVPELTRAERARLRLLDKMTGQVRVVEFAVGESREVERLEIDLRDCRVPAADSRAEAVAYLNIRDLREESARFAGWMFASSPALSALDHARYDVWVESCSTSSGDASSGSE